MSTIKKSDQNATLKGYQSYLVCKSKLQEQIHSLSTTPTCHEHYQILERGTTHRPCRVTLKCFNSSISRHSRLGCIANANLHGSSKRKGGKRSYLLYCCSQQPAQKKYLRFQNCSPFLQLSEYAPELADQIAGRNSHPSWGTWSRYHMSYNT